MLSANIMAAPSAAGHGINGGTKKIQSGTRMARPGPQRKWTNSQLSDAKYLMAHNFSASKVGKILKTTKNAVLGALYRDKVSNGYIPPENSKYTGQKNL